MTEETRICSKCSREVPVSALALKRRGRDRDYRRSWCKRCDNRRQTEARKLNPARLAREREKEWHYKRRPSQRPKVLARIEVMNALKTGRLTKKPCEACGAAKTEAHHDDYSKPLEVRWLCQEHHLAVHGHVK